MNILQGHNHYKLYKSGKLWVAALIVATGLMTVPSVAHADGNDAAPVTIQADQQKATADATRSVAKVDGSQQTPITDNGQVKSEDQQAKTSFDNDQDLQNQLSHEINFDQQVLGKGTIFHIFSKNAGLYVDTNGNFATDKLIDNPDFGSRNSTYNHTKKDVYYIGNAEKLAPNGFRTDKNYVILGDDSNVEFNGDQVIVNGVRLDHLKKADVKIAKGYLDIDGELRKLSDNAKKLAAKDESQKVKKDFSDMNNQVIDVSGAQDDLIIINIDGQKLCNPQPITIKGLSSKQDGPAIILNVSGDQDINWQTQIKLIYDDGTQLSAGESHSKPNHVLWNFGTANRTVNIQSGYLMGSVLVPNGTINVGVNADGNLIAHDVNVSGGESHRWDLWAPSYVDDNHPTTPDKPVTPPTQPDESKQPGKPDDSKKPEKPQDATDKQKPSTPAQPTTPEEPVNPTNPETTTPDEPDNSTSGQPDKPGETAKPVTPDEPETPDNPQTPDEPTTPDTPEEPTKPTQPETPDTPDQPDQPNTPEEPTKPTQPEIPDIPDNPDQPDIPETPENPTPGQPEEPMKPTQPETPDIPDQPDQPDAPENPTVPPYDHGDYVVEIPKHDQPATPSDTPEKPDQSNPAQPETPVNPVTPATPDNPGKTDQPGITDHPKQETPGTPDQPTPDEPKTDEPATPTIPQNPEVPTDTEKTPTPDQPTEPTPSETPKESTTSTDVEVETNEPGKKQSSVVAVAVPQQAKQQDTALPQTGNQDSQLSLFAVLTLSLGGFLSLLGLKKKQ